jgi:uncharacterized MAPEG superfamily protein
MSLDFGSEETRMLWASVLLGLVQLLLAVLFSLGARGMPWALGPRDDAGAAMTNLGGRVERAFKNFLETFPFFATVVLLASAMNKHTSMTILGAQLYFYGRVLYVPLYAFGVPVARTLAWGTALAGILLVFFGIVPGI